MVYKVYSKFKIPQYYLGSKPLQSSNTFIFVQRKNAVLNQACGGTYNKFLHIYTSVSTVKWNAETISVDSTLAKKPAVQLGYCEFLYSKRWKCPKVSFVWETISNTLSTLNYESENCIKLVYCFLSSTMGFFFLCLNNCDKQACPRHKNRVLRKIDG